ncbi:MAG TPA: PD-(D/E)XK nuclease family protein [Acidimicrobiales bacterium]|nr:PD-(D/E)XK nuclease family protein [Acidimicrobiales bacterium]
MAAELTPAQQDVLDLLRAAGVERPVVDPDLRHRLRDELEGAIAPLAASLDRPLWVAKAALGRVQACETHHLDEEAADFEWSVPAARGTVAHKAIELSLHLRGDPTPLGLVDAALDRLGDDPDSSLASFLLGLDEPARADLRSEVNAMVASFVELWPPLQRAWRPETESRRRVELCGGRVILSGKVDLTLGAPAGVTAGRLVVDLKTGTAHAGHVDDLRFYALLDTLRGGVPPFRVASYYLDSGTFRPEDVTPAVLEAAVRRTVAGVTRMAELRLGLRSPAVTPNPTCRWCRLRHDCDGARTWAEAGAEDQPGR